MANTEHVSVAVQEDFIARQTRAKPVPALAELIWNGLDADATDVTVEFAYDDLAGGMSKVVVYDNGTGFSREDANALFGNLGGSWKRSTRQTKRERRMVHGQEGRGRYKAFALGRSVRWKVCYETPTGNRAFQIDLFESDLKDVTISADVPAPDRKTGVIVEITDLRRDFKVFESPEGLQDLAETFALYLINYRAVSIAIAGERLDPEKAIAGQHQASLSPIVTADGQSLPVDLHVIEWHADTKRTLYLCSANGFPLDQVETRFHVQGFAFSAYLKSAYVEALHNDGRMGLAELDPALVVAVEEARNEIKAYFRERASERAYSVVEEWKEADIYPYSGEPANTTERAERQIFDIVAAQVQQYTPDIEATSKKTRALQLWMLKNAIERGPEELQSILKEVLDLPVAQQKAFAALLQETNLSSIITAAKTVADRLKFLSALESIVFDTEKKRRLKERTQLHKILAENTWVFGEEYNLWVSDQGLRKLLEKHKRFLDPNIAIEEPVKVVGQKVGIVDLMFSRLMRRHKAGDVDHLVVELKAPKVVIGSDEIAQVKKYAQAVANDERFNTVKGLRWHFWVLSNAYDEYAAEDIDSVDRERRLVRNSNGVTVGIKTWAELIDENRARLQFFQEKLDHRADESEAIRYLQERHSKFLKGVIVEGEADNENATSEADTAKSEDVAIIN